MATHRFTPRQYHNTLGSHAPVLRVHDGDTVVTTTLDARGYDAQGAAAAPRGNPQTGPFYVEGAEPGDMLEVRLDRLTPSRAIGWSGTVIAPNVLDPAYVRETPAGGVTLWHIDLERRIIALAHGGAPSPPIADIDPRHRAVTRAELSRLAPLAIALQPMVGCFGVAPPDGQAISTATSGPHGGNMDYRGFRAGTTVYFPVFVPGALLHVGDGHALQGDGEIVGTGIEISFDVQVTVHLLKGKKITWPRAENSDYLMTVGNARPLDQALQHATTELMHWLMEDY